MPRKQWAKASEVMRSWRFRVMPDRLAILNTVWEKEMGHLSRHWKLRGVKGGSLYVFPRSPAAAMELRMREGVVIRGLNKYFRTPWIKEIKTAIRKDIKLISIERRFKNNEIKI